MHEEPKAALRGDTEASADERPAATFGYCCECGTWDSHGAICVTCGIDFRSDADMDAAR